MKRNVEIKARLADVHKMIDKLCDLGYKENCILHQEDYFFNSPNGRLKLRILEGEQMNEAQLIFYERQDSTGPKLSNFVISEVVNARNMIDVLTLALGMVGIVKKTRNLFLIGQTRVHIDTVEGLGTFIELEVVLDENQSEDTGKKIANDIMASLGINEELISCAYIDIILQNNGAK